MYFFSLIEIFLALFLTDHRPAYILLVLLIFVKCGRLNQSS